MLFGADRIEENRGRLSGRLALVTTPTGVTSDGISTIDVLRELCDLRLLLGPEHGVRGKLADGQAFDSGIDPVSGLPVMSMYREDGRGIPPEAYELFDTLVYDIQDVGVRFYTFISTLKNAMTDCASHGKRVVVLDRPNPLGGTLEGTLRTPDTESFVGCHDIPVRYGQTCGEFALMVKDELGLDLDLHVVKCSGLTQSMSFEDWGKSWRTPSPALKDPESIWLYPGTCFLEGTNVSEGRGTGSPFRTIGAPYINGEAFAKALNDRALPGITCEPVTFVPSVSKYKGESCGGIFLSVTDSRALRPVTLGYHILDLLRLMYPGEYGLRQYTENAKIPFISLLAGHRLFEDNSWSLDEILAAAERDCRAFDARRSKYSLYDRF